jgi:hypothetical protein
MRFELAIDASYIYYLFESKNGKKNTLWLKEREREVEFAINGATSNG